jgi:hypothetical protein
MNQNLYLGAAAALVQGMVLAWAVVAAAVAAAAVVAAGG